MANLTQGKNLKSAEFVLYLDHTLTFSVGWTLVNIYAAVINGSTLLLMPVLSIISWTI